MKLNGIRVDPQLEQLINRSDWSGKRTDSAWMWAFPAHPMAERMPFVDLCTLDDLSSENAAIWRERKFWRLTEDLTDSLAGVPDPEYPPGDVDVHRAYLIGFTDYCDSGIFIDARPDVPRVIFDNLNPMRATYATAFESVDAFVAFYLSNVEETQ